MRLAIYARVSTEEQAQNGTSLEVQQAQARGFAEKLGHSVAIVITDVAISGSVALERRAGGRALIHALATKVVDGVVVVRLDRLFRDLLDGLLFFRDAGGGQVLSCSELIDTTSPQGRFQLNMRLAAAQYERDLASQRAMDNTRGLREAGRVYGSVPYGCMAIDGHLYREPKRWRQREEIVRMRAEAMSYDTIRHSLRDRHIPAPAGGKWWSKSSLKVLIDTHGDLVHLPALSEQFDAEAASIPDRRISSGTASDHNLAAPKRARRA